MMHRHLCAVLIGLQGTMFASASSATSVHVDIPGVDGGPSMRVAVDVGSASTFRLSVAFLFNPEVTQPDDLPPLDSPSLDPKRTMAAATRVSSNGKRGLKTAFGELLIAANGVWVLNNPAGKQIAAATAPPKLSMEHGTGSEGGQRPGITMAVTGSKTGPGANGRRPCLVNGGWGPPFTWDPKDNYFAFAVSPWSYDPDYMHCYPVSFDGDGRYPSPEQEDTCTTITHVVPENSSAVELAFVKVDRSGGDSTNSCCNACNAMDGCTAWMMDRVNGPGGNNCHLYSCVEQWVPPDVSGGNDGRYLSGGLESSQCKNTSVSSPYIHQDGWFVLGSRADWYLAPTPKGGFDYTKALYDLTGAPAVPPLFGMGFMATYWGYTSMQEVEAYMHEFRDRKLPIDSFIMDYDWFGPNPCGSNPDAQGEYNCGDYGYRGHGWWNNVTFNQSDGTAVTCTDAADVFNHFKAPPLNMHFGGIRKPRTYSNKKLSQGNGWLLPNASDVGEGGDINFNFSDASMRAWYTKTHGHFIEDGMDFWWNDEGETSWFTYLLWNQAQAQQWTDNKPNTRHFTINRAWQPGMQRFPAIAWTGDGQSCTHQELLRGMLNGASLTSCDLTSPDATTLVRQYQSAVFTPIMRVHMMGGTPRFPWFWPNDAKDPTFNEHQEAFKAALGMRYKFLPFMYSLAHAAHRTGKPISHPASFAFPEECRDSSSASASASASASTLVSVPSKSNANANAKSAQCTAVETTYMVGEVLIPSDLGLAHTNDRPPPLENASSAYLPTLPSPRVAAGAGWYRWNTTTQHKGGQTVHETLGLAEMAVFVRPGAILPLQSNGTIQHSAEAGGTLEVQVYAGADGTFVLVEDDGISYDYATNAEGATRTTTWSWSDSSKTLSWAVAGGSMLMADKSTTGYNKLEAILFEAGTLAPQRATVQALPATGGGKVIFD